MAIALTTWTGGAAAAAFSGVVTHVTDGDTLWVQPDDRSAPPVKLRLQGIDAPESCQVWGHEATAALRARLQHQHVWVRVRAKDAYARGIAQLRSGGEDIAEWMVSQGHAWSPGYRRHPGPYAAQERQARSRAWLVRRPACARTAAVQTAARALCAARGSRRQ
jgi:micrococcal nuclease